MKRDNLRHLLLSMIQIARNIFPNSKLFIFLFLLLKFTGVIIISNALEHHIEKNMNTYHLFQQITFYVSLTRKKINLLPYPIECIIIYFLLCLPVITFFFIIINHTKYSIKSNTSDGSRYLILGDSMASFLYFRLFKLFSLISRYERLGGNSALIERNKFFFRNE